MLNSLLQHWLAPLARKLIFYPAPPSHLLYAKLRSRELTVVTNNIQLHGWHIENPAWPSQSSLLYFGGNAEDVVHSLGFLASLPVHHVFAFNYRGYGLSKGRPSETALFSDADTLHQYLQTRFALLADRMHVVGRSLGSAVATHLASMSSLRSVTLITPLQSIEAIGGELLPWLPVSRLLADKFDLMEKARQIKTPLLAIIAGQDEVIPNAHSQALFEAWKGPKQLQLITMADHNTVTGYPECPRAMADFLRMHGS